MRPTPAKIIQHAEGMGAPNAETVRLRAREIALINGHAEFNDEDWREAKRELHGGHEVINGNGDLEMAALVSEHDMVVGDLGHRVETMAPDDGDSILEELIAEGMDEALHEQMLAARRAEPVEEEEV